MFWMLFLNFFKLSKHPLGNSIYQYYFKKLLGNQMSFFKKIPLICPKNLCFGANFFIREKNLPGELNFSFGIWQMLGESWMSFTTSQCLPKCPSMFGCFWTKQSKISLGSKNPIGIKRKSCVNPQMSFPRKTNTTNMENVFGCFVFIPSKTPGNQHMPIWLNWPN